MLKVRANWNGEEIDVKKNEKNMKVERKNVRSEKNIRSEMCKVRYNFQSEVKYKKEKENMGKLYVRKNMK